MADYYLHLTNVVENETREEWLRYTHNEMMGYYAREKLIDGWKAQHNIANAAKMSSKMLRSAIHKMSCHLMRRLAGLGACGEACCCDCPAAPEKLYCIGRMTKDLANDSNDE